MTAETATATAHAARRVVRVPRTPGTPPPPDPLDPQGRQRTEPEAPIAEASPAAEESLAVRASDADAVSPLAGEEAVPGTGPTSRRPAVDAARIGVVVAAPRPGVRAGGGRWRQVLRGVRRVVDFRAVRTHFGSVAGVVILSVLLWRLGTGVFLDGLRRIDGPTLAPALAIGLATTVLSAWRWALVARGLRIRLPFGAAVADYYRALFLNAALPGGVLGDVHRAVRHGRSEGDVGRAVRTVVLERAAGQAALAVVGVVVLLTMDSPVRTEARDLAPLIGLAAVGALAVVVALRMNGTSARRSRAPRATLAEAREALLSRRNGPGVVVSSVLVLAGHVGMFVLAARVAGSDAPFAALLPIAVLALVAMGLPLNVGGWGPREGVTAWAFGAAGLGASNGLAVAVVYGVLSFVAALPGAVVLVVRWGAALRAGSGPAASAPEPDRGYASDGSSPAGGESSEKYAPKESTRLARSSSPFSAEPSEGRPMTPESV